MPENLVLPADAVRVRGLDKTYAASGKRAAKEALKGIDLAIPRGCLFGLLGPNGAGKSTLINILAQLVNKSAGEVQVWGFDLDKRPRDVASAIGVVPQELNIDPFFTPRELLDLQAGLYGVPKAERRTDEILAAVGLSDRADSYARTLSGGMRRRLLVAKALVHNPPVLVLDEPTAGVDVGAKAEIHELIRALAAAGAAILLASSDLPELLLVCDRVIALRGGVAVGEVTAADATEPRLAALITGAAA